MGPHGPQAAHQTSHISRTHTHTHTDESSGMHLHPSPHWHALYTDIQRSSDHNNKEHNPDHTTRTLQGVVVASDQFSCNDDSCTLTEFNDVTDEKVIDKSKSATATFSIFDGTNASNRWSSFVFEGDSQDEEADETATEAEAAARAEWLRRSSVI